LARSTAMPVREVSGRLTVKPNRVYVIPSDTRMALEHGQLKLLPRGQTARMQHSTDGFLAPHTLNSPGRAVSVIHPDIASGGASGPKAVKTEAGLAFARTQAEQLLASTKLELQHANNALRATNVQLEQRVKEMHVLAAEIRRSKEVERRRIARILHEDLQQLIFGARIRLDSVCLNRNAKSFQKELRRIMALLEQAVEISRNLSHELSPVVLQKDGLVAALKWLARWMKEHHGLTVQVKAPAAAEPADENVKAMLFHAVRELLFNIVKHAGVNRARVWMTRNRDRQIDILVSDKGSGFDPAVAMSYSEMGANFGLLSIQEQLKLCHARMEVTSAPGRGSRFRIVAPPNQADEVKLEPGFDSVTLPARQLQPPAPVPSIAPDGQSRIRVLLVDDHEIVREGLAVLLRQHQAIDVAGMAFDGIEAITQVRNLQPDLVIMDVNMPRMDGIEATRRITAAWPHIKVIGLTMHSDSSRHRAMRAAGAVNCLEKSGAPADLARLILKHAKRGHVSTKPA
ncbi:MAG TPA: response regulator, partial [Candidatus Binatia bacterium]|nr:response regulator [Candidatus Binatia bacterium]